MKYIRKLVAFILSIAFCAAVIIGLGVILAVKNVNVEFIKYSAEGSDEAVMTEYYASKQNLEKLKGSNLLFLGEEDVFNCVGSDAPFFIVSCEKIFPCTVNILLKERVETFAFATDEGYNIYDETGKLLRVSKSNLNSLDGSPNVLVEADLSDLGTVASLCSFFRKDFTTLRNYVKSVTVGDSLIDRASTFIFNLHTGLKIVIADYETLPEEKVWAAYVEYLSLSESQRLSGTISVVDSNGEASSVQAVYSA